MVGYTIVDQPPQNDPVDMVRTIDDLLVLTQEPASGPLEKEALAKLQVLAQFREQLRQRLEEVPERLGSSQISSNVLRVAYAGCRHLNWVVFGNLPPRVIAAAIASDELQGAFALSLCVNLVQLVGDKEDRESDLSDLAAALAQSRAFNSSTSYSSRTGTAAMPPLISARSCYSCGRGHQEKTWSRSG